MALLVPDTGKLAYGRKRQRCTLLDAPGEARLKKEMKYHAVVRITGDPMHGRRYLRACEFVGRREVQVRKCCAPNKAPNGFGFPSRVGWPCHLRSSLITQSVCWMISRLRLCSPGAD